MKQVIYLSIIIALFLQSCANPKAPTGGEKDITAPIIDTTYPTNFSTNIKVNKFIFEFNEPIEVNNIEQNLIITPYIDNPFKTSIKKNKLTISFEKPFNDNTTYTLNFGESIRDITEKNKTKNIKFVFSTGDYLDSLNIEVKAKFPLSNKACKECLVSLYNSNDTNTIEKNKPFYFSYTSKNGKAKIENIKDGNYLVYVLDDANGNYIYDKGESIAFYDDTVNLKSDLNINKLDMINENERIQKIIYQNTSINNHQIKLQKGITSFELTDTLFNKIKNIKYWYSDNYNINIVFKPDYNNNYKLITVDSIQVIDTLDVKFILDSTSKYINILTETSLKPLSNIELKLSNSIKNINTTKFKISRDSTFTKIKNIIYDSLKRTITISIPKTYKNDKKIIIKIDTNAISSNEISNNKQKFKFTIAEKSDLGIISGKVNCNKSFTLELLDNNYKIIEQYKDIDEFLIEDLKPGSYKMRLKVDNNKNGYWEAGNFKKRMNPETVIFHNEEIKLRKNWEIKDINLKCPSK